MADAIISSCLKTIYDSNSGQIRSLGIELRHIQGILRDADMGIRVREPVREFALAVQDMAYDAVDLVEWYFAAKDNAGRCAFILKGSTKIMASEIGILQTRISNLFNIFGSSGILGVRYVEEEADQWTYSFISDVDERIKDDVGVKDDVDVLVRSLLSEAVKYRVVAICGMRGLGKTAVARQVYDHPEVRRYFDEFCWISVSQQWRKGDILKNMLDSLAPDEAWDQIEEDQLVLQLRTLLEGKRCLILLDDIWSPQPYMAIEHVFAAANVKILLTTRNVDVATSIDPHAFVHQLNFLDEARSLELLKRKVGLTNFEDDVGVKDDVDVLVQSLLSEAVKYRVVAICGMGGLGKTAVARQVYHHPEVGRYFDECFWIFVSQQWRKGDILKNMLKSLVPDKAWDGIGEDELALQLCTLLEGKRCLILLDDIWSPQPYMAIKHVFAAPNVKILLTTRNVDVATSIDPHAFVHQLNFLDEARSLELLKRKVGLTNFEGGEREDVESLQRKMVKFCDGLPLTLLFLGEELSGRPFREWGVVFHNIKHHLFNDSERRRYLRNTLGLSYNDLPSELKPCFLYLGSFPENTEIKAETVYQLWIAEGLVPMLYSTGNNESVMGLAQGYLGELSRRGMVRLQRSDEPMMITGKYKSCRLNNLMWGLCLAIAEDELFFNINGSERQRKRVFVSSALPTPAFRRMVINLSPGHQCLDNLQKRQETSKLRMLQIFRLPRESLSGTTIIGSQLDKAMFLRVLSLEGLRLGLLEAIGKLLLVRYLSFKDSSLDTLPASLTKLKHLETLDLRVLKLRRLPDILWKMQGLTFLYLPSFYRLGRQLFKLRLHGLINLEILENFSDRVSDPHDLLKLTNLRVLSADCFSLENLKKVSDNACTNKRLRHVSISTDCDFSSDMKMGLTFLHQSFFGSDKIHCFRSRGAISKFPIHDSTSTSSNLVQLSMNLFGLKGDHDVTGTLKRLTNLRSLSLSGYQGRDDHMIFHTNAFPQLTNLRLFSFLKMKTWVVEDKALPNLSLLLLWGLPVLEMIPQGLASITTLKELDIRNMPEKFKERIRTKDGADFEKIKHIPSILYS